MSNQVSIWAFTSGVTCAEFVDSHRLGRVKKSWNIGDLLRFFDFDCNGSFVTH